ncbi:MAG: YqaA family protein [Dysgonomonas sp.]
MIETLATYGYLGLFIACFISATIIPFSSDILLIALVAAGLDWRICLIVASTANWLGGMTCYYLGKLGKIEWIEKHSKIKREKIEQMQQWLQGKGAAMAFFSWIPIVGNIMVIALGYIRANVLIVNVSLFAGKFCRYVVIIFLTLKGIDLIRLF